MLWPWDLHVTTKGARSLRRSECRRKGTRCLQSSTIKETGIDVVVVLLSTSEEHRANDWSSNLGFLDGVSLTDIAEGVDLAVAVTSQEPLLVGALTNSGEVVETA